MMMFNHVPKLKWLKFVVGVISECPSVAYNPWGARLQKDERGTSCHLVLESSVILIHLVPSRSITLVLGAEDRHGIYGSPYHTSVTRSWG